MKNQSPIDQPDNPGPEFIDELPDELILEGVAADGGIAESQGNRAIWNGPIEGQGQVIISIEARLRTSVLQGQVITNQGTVFFDSNGLGFNESDALTTDPETGGATAFATGAEIPLLSDFLLPLLTLLLTGAGVHFVRSR